MSEYSYTYKPTAKVYPAANATDGGQRLTEENYTNFIYKLYNKSFVSKSSDLVLDVDNNDATKPLTISTGSAYIEGYFVTLTYDLVIPLVNAETLQTSYQPGIVYSVYLQVLKDGTNHCNGSRIIVKNPNEPLPDLAILLGTFECARVGQSYMFSTELNPFRLLRTNTDDIYHTTNESGQGESFETLDSFITNLINSVTSSGLTSGTVTLFNTGDVKQSCIQLTYSEVQYPVLFEDEMVVSEISIDWYDYTNQTKTLRSNIATLYGIYNTRLRQYRYKLINDLYCNDVICADITAHQVNSTTVQTQDCNVHNQLNAFNKIRLVDEDSNREVGYLLVQTDSDIDDIISEAKLDSIKTTDIQLTKSLKDNNNNTIIQISGQPKVRFAVWN